MEIKKKLLKCLMEAGIVDTNAVYEDIMNEDMSELNANSINYIKLIVNVEDMFDLEFDDNYLDVSTFKNINEMLHFIEERI